jgi:hypothetical protein
MKITQEKFVGMNGECSGCGQKRKNPEVMLKPILLSQ